MIENGTNLLKNSVFKKKKKTEKKTIKYIKKRGQRNEKWHKLKYSQRKGWSIEETKIHK